MKLPDGWRTILETTSTGQSGTRPIGKHRVYVSEYLTVKRGMTGWLLFVDGKRSTHLFATAEKAIRFADDARMAG
jgi:hypothetical protein